MRYFIISICLGLLTACASGTQNRQASQDQQYVLPHPEATPFDARQNAKANLEAAMAQAYRQNKRTLTIMGANWCDDSRALAGHLFTQRFQQLIAENYVLNFIDVGNKDRNIDIAQGFGLEAISYIPTIIITTPQGQVVNFDRALELSNSAKRSGDDIYAYFEGYTK